MAYNYKAYTRADVKNEYPGYLNNAWIAPRSAFTLLQEPDPGPTPAQGDTVIIATAHTFPVGEGFVPIYCAPDSVEGNGTLIGPKGSKRTKWQPKIIIPGDSPALLEQVKAMMNDDVIIIFKDATCPGSQLIQFGCDCSPSNVSEGQFTSSNTGADDGRKAWELTFDAYCKYFYDATIAIKPAA